MMPSQLEQLHGRRRRVYNFADDGDSYDEDDEHYVDGDTSACGSAPSPSTSAPSWTSAPRPSSPSTSTSTSAPPWTSAPTTSASAHSGCFGSGGLLRPTPSASELFTRLRDPTNPFFHPSLLTGVDAVTPGIFWHSGSGPFPYDAGSTCITDIGAIANPVYKEPRAGQLAWLRIPCQAPAMHARLWPWRHSEYGGLRTEAPVTGYHRTSTEAMLAPLVRQDWANGYRNVTFPGLFKDGVIRNGINDSRHRGVWFYLHFLHPWPPTSTEIVVELFVRQSSIHQSKTKIHMKFCATPDEDAPGDPNPYVDVTAIHVPQTFVPPQHWPQHA